jgi:Fic family protein
MTYKKEEHPKDKNNQKWMDKNRLTGKGTVKGGLNKSIVLPNKFSLNRTENIFTIKKYWDESIYSSMLMEGRNVTFPQTKAILEKAKISNIETIDVLAINNFKKGWQFLLNTIDKENTISYYKNLNKIVAQDEALVSGEFRTGEIGIGGTNYKPPVLSNKDIERWFDDKTKNITQKNTTQKAIELFAESVKLQNFWDGNKRTSFLMANKLLVQNNKGMLIVWHDKVEEFNTLLNAFYSKN